MDKKFELLKSDYISLKRTNSTVYRIRALKNFFDVKAGDLGGYVSSESCLDQNDDSWIYDDAIVVNSTITNSRIYNDTFIRDSFIEGCKISCKYFSYILNSKIQFSTLKYKFLINNCNIFCSKIRSLSCKDFNIKYLGIKGKENKLVYFEFDKFLKVSKISGDVKILDLSPSGGGFFQNNKTNKCQLRKERIPLRF